MSACAICLDTLKSPIALPCGHVYCHDCIASLVKLANGALCTTNCPTCRTPFPIVALNPYLVPINLRPYILPPFRRLYLNTSSDSPTPSSSTSPEPDDVRQLTARLQTENATLRKSCQAWRQRADAHATAHLGLTALVRLAKDQALLFRKERDELARNYESLKRKLSDGAEDASAAETGDADQRDETAALFSGDLWSASTRHAHTSHEDDGPMPDASSTEPEDDEARRYGKRRKVWTEVHGVAPKLTIPAMVIPYVPSRPTDGSTRGAVAGQ